MFTIECSCPGESSSSSPDCTLPTLSLREVTEAAIYSTTRTVSTVLVKPPIKDALKEDKPSNKGQVESTHVYKFSSELEDNFSTKGKMAGPKGVFY